MAIPSRFIEELKNRISLSDVVGKRVTLARAGREYKACCPFHHEKTPSFTVNNEKQFYHCFGCGEHGTAIDFVMKYDNLSFPEAVELLAGSVGMQVPKETPDQVKKNREEKSLYGLMEDACCFFENCLKDGRNTAEREYLHNRGVDDRLVSEFRIGYAPADGQALGEYLTGRGYSTAQMLEAGVMRPSKKKEGELYAFFRERIMFPVMDMRGRVVAFGGRILPDHMRVASRTGGYEPPKYMNSAETSLFHKGSMLYCGKDARKAAGGGETVVVVEGYLDVIACNKAGFRAAVAPLGTAITEEQIVSLWRMIPGDEKIPVLCFDGDRAGRNAAARVVDKILPLLKPDHSVRFAFLPDGEDPDSLINSQGRKAFDSVIEGAVSLVNFIWGSNVQGKRFDTPEARAGLSRALEQIALRIEDRSVQHYYRRFFRNKVNEVFGSPFFRKGGWKNAGRGAGYTGNAGGRGVESTLSRIRKPAYSRKLVSEMALLAGLVNYPKLFEHVEERLGSICFSENWLDSMRQAVLSTLGHEDIGDDEADAGTADVLVEALAEKGLDVGRLLSESVYVHASWCRPGVELEKVRKNWDMAWNLVYGVEAVDKDLKGACDDYSQNPCGDNESRFIALREIKKETGGL